MTSHLCFQVSGLQTQLQDQTHMCDSLSEQLAAAESQSEEKAATIATLKQEVEHLKQDVKVIHKAADVNLADMWKRWRKQLIDY